MCKSVNMLGYRMEVDYGSHVKSRLRDRFDGLDVSFLEYRIETLFEEDAVADYLLNEVRIGEEVVLIDEDSGITFAVAVGVDQFYIKTVYNACSYSRMRCGDNQQVLKYAQKEGFRSERFERKRGDIYA